MRKKTLSMLMVIVLSAQGVFALSLQQITDNAILRARREANYGKFTVDLYNGYTSSIQFLNYELESFEGEFKLAVNNGYNNTLSGSTGFIQHMDAQNIAWLNTYYSGSVGSRERAKSMFMSNLYRNFLVVWKDPNSDSPYTNPGGGTYYSETRTYTAIDTFYTTNGKIYTIWRSNDNLYWYRQGSGKAFSSETAVKTYIEVQNRLIYTAPNSRKYGIFKIGSRYYFNRDNGSISSLSWVSVNDVKAYINQHNQPRPGCERVAEGGRCLY